MISLFSNTLFEYLHKTTFLKKMADMAAVILLSLIIFSVYTVFVHYDKIVTQYILESNEVNSSENSNTVNDIENFSEYNISLNDILYNLVNTNEFNRLSVYEINNIEDNISEYYRIGHYSDNFVEDVHSQHLHDTYVSVDSTIEYLRNNNCVIVRNGDEQNNHLILRNYMREYGIKVLIRCPLMSTDNELLGFSQVEYIIDEEPRINSSRLNSIKNKLNIINEAYKLLQ